MLATNYQRVRLWSGVSALGINLAMAWGAYFAAPTLERWLLGWPLAAQVAVVVVAATLLLLPFEILVGHAIERMVERTDQTLKSWLQDWFQGVIRFALPTIIGGTVLGFGDTWWWPIKVGAGLLLVVAGFVTAEQFYHLLPQSWKPAESPDPAFVGALRECCVEMNVPPAHIAWVEDTDAFTSTGVVVSPVFMAAREENGMIIPAVGMTTAVSRYLQPRQAALMMARELFILKCGYRRKALLLSMLWLGAGLGLAWWLPLGASPLAAGLGGMAFMSTWCLLALFVFPPLSRRWVLKADQFLLTLAEPEEIRDCLSLLQELNATDITVESGKGYLFHSIPPLEHRLRELGFEMQMQHEPDPANPVSH
ncbi:MAG: hypothetical protein JSR82_11555 [Verrucomicrobia bacterium]|nr:hypothetical protein [Verrucomicrobiota bacterium]